MKRSRRSRSVLMDANLLTPAAVSNWALQRGLMGFYVVSVFDVRRMARWEIRSGNETIKSFYADLNKKQVRQRALDWATTMYDIPAWGKIEGMEAFFDYFMLRILRESYPDLVIFKVS